MLTQTLNHAQSQRERYLQELFELLRIPSVSTLAEHAEDVQKAAQWLAAHLNRIGLQEVQVIPTDDNPVVYGEWLAADKSMRTVLIYGHYDVQPPDPLEDWKSQPFVPEVRQGRVYARGASDNKAQFFSHIKALESTLAVQGKLPINVKMVLDGEEEVGSPNLEQFVHQHTALLAADSGLISDGAMVRAGQPTIKYGVRGLAYVELQIQGPRRDLHSGSYGGTVYNPAQALAEIITALHNEDGSVAIPGFYDKVLPISMQERSLLGKVPYTLQQWREETGMEIPWGEDSYAPLERICVRPTCEVNGIWGGFQDQGSKTIIPAQAGAKISMRLVPDQDPDEIAQLFIDYVKQLAPPHVTVDLVKMAGCWPALMPLDSIEMDAAAKACRSVWQVEPVFSRSGGSLPVIAAFQRALDTPFVLLPFGLDDNRHSPNEHYHIENFFRGIETAIHYYHYLGEHSESR